VLLSMMSWSEVRSAVPDSWPVTSIYFPVRPGFVLSPHWERNAEGIWT